ncbi:MAG: SRPBCC family protein [Bauldia sp.]
MSAPMPETRSVVVEREIAAPPEKIWRALTQPHLLQEWLMQNDFRPAVGHRFNLRKDAGGYPIVIDCEVLALDEPKKLAFSWNYTVGDPAYDTATVVTFTLTPTGGGTTHLRMEQAGFRTDQRQALAGATAAWREFMDELLGLLTRME